MVKHNGHKPLFRDVSLQGCRLPKRILKERVVFVPFRIFSLTFTHDLLDTETVQNPSFISLKR
jgi:hypothetical protein